MTGEDWAMFDDDDDDDDDRHGAADHAADPRLQEGLDHLQRAAREMIAATRALLDVAEELVDDPRAVGSIVAGFGSLAKAASRATMGWSGSAGHGRADDDGDPGVQRIPIS
ncbi:MAG: hypothetical protein JWM05_3631 [Acidimicrobiales bacterium]|nr:hypothetical protein [Acidimicrobiales bacterium]